MTTPGRNRGMVYGAGFTTGIDIANFGTTFDMKAANAGFCGRFTALSTKDIKSVRVFWAAFTVGTGTMTLRIETIDATSGKPTGTLYDANAVIASITPVANSITTYTFASLPTTGLVIGQEYGVVLLTTAAFTACEYRYITATGIQPPSMVLTAADGTTRTNFAEVSNTHPAISFILDDDTEDPFTCHGFWNTTTLPIYGTLSPAGKMTISHTINIVAVFAMISKAGTPAGNLRCRVMDSSDNVIANTTVILDKDSLSLVTSAKLTRFFFGAVVTLQPGTYRIVFDSASSANSSNCFQLRVGNPLNVAVTAASSFKSSTTADVTATPITWTDDASGILTTAQFILDDIISPVNPELLVGI